MNLNHQVNFIGDGEVREIATRFQDGQTSLWIELLCLLAQCERDDARVECHHDRDAFVREGLLRVERDELRVENQARGELRLGAGVDLASDKVDRISDVRRETPTRKPCEDVPLQEELWNQ